MQKAEMGMTIDYFAPQTKYTETVLPNVGVVKKHDAVSR